MAMHRTCDGVQRRDFLKVGVLGGSAKLDTYSRAHLTESAARIRKVLDARLALAAP